MTDDVSPGEVYRRLVDHEQRTDRVHASLDSRVTDLAKDTVTVRMWQEAEQDRDREVQALTGRVSKLEERPAMTFGRWIAILTVAAAFLALAVQAYGTMKGAK
ncbi:hypothetical protein AAW14_06615 [Streptomyces hygroscopicus]|uniref:hypothetical protein n=1 Tax=Streptomyces hygroscopicus TaxID=1912 RepID=UPI0022404F0F|nr:hypothetical protein [Streptomyces hygroscopicus]MCW7941705.1 hypothetical protein [Streptomyces hygroscopicus]